jgi:D-sedoheptulose 7-phosphate isomerase
MKKNFKNFTKNYLTKLEKLFKEIDLDRLSRLETELESLRKNNSTLFVFGNGGGSATATTMANDLGFDIKKKTKVKNTFKIISLNDNSAVVTAIANDIGYENIFLKQLEIHYKKGDKILIFSASGNSENLLKAANWIKKKGGRVISILGFDGGKLKKISDLSVHIKTEKGDYGPVEDIQLIINHIFAHWFQYKFK